MALGPTIAVPDVPNDVKFVPAQVRTGHGKGSHYNVQVEVMVQEVRIKCRYMGLALQL